MTGIRIYGRSDNPDRRTGLLGIRSSSADRLDRADDMEVATIIRKDGSVQRQRSEQALADNSSDGLK